MLENFFINLKAKINLTKRNSNCSGSEKENNAPDTARQMLDNFLPNRRVRYASVNQNDEFRQTRMFPRVTYGDDNAWGPVDLAPKEKFVEDMDNVIDKFIHVISSDNNDTGALRTFNVISLGYNIRSPFFYLNDGCGGLLEIKTFYCLFLQKRNDREEIRRRLAMGSDYDYFGRAHSDRPTRKPSLHSRLQGGKLC